MQYARQHDFDAVDAAFTTFMHVSHTPHKTFFCQQAQRLLVLFRNLYNLFDFIFIQHCYQQEGNNADRPFKVNYFVGKKRFDACQRTAWNKPESNAEKAHQRSPESRAATAQAGSEHRKEEYTGQAAGHRQTGNHCLNNACRIEGKPQSNQADSKNRQTIDDDKFIFRNSRINKAFVNIITEERSRTQQNSAGSRYIRSPQSSQP